MIKHNLCVYVCVFKKSKIFVVEMQSLAKRYETASLSWRLGEARQTEGKVKALWNHLCRTRAESRRPSNWKEYIIFYLNLLWVTFYAVWMNELFSSRLVLFVCYFSLMNAWLWGLCHTPEIFVQLLLQIVCLVTSLKLSHCLAISPLSYTCPSTLYTREM